MRTYVFRDVNGKRIEQKANTLLEAQRLSGAVMTRDLDARPQLCEARQQSDQKCCNRCGLLWDMNDPEPPECLTERQVSNAALANLREVGL